MPSLAVLATLVACVAALCGVGWVATAVRLRHLTGEERRLRRSSEAVEPFFALLAEQLRTIPAQPPPLHSHAAAAGQAILEAAADGIVTIDESSIIQTANPAAERIFGYRGDELVGGPVAMLMPEPYRGAHDGYVRSYLATGNARIIGIGREVLGRRKDGTTFPMDLSVGECRQAGRRVFAGVIRDITERRAMAERLRHSEERFRCLVDGLPDTALSLLDSNGTVVFWSRGGLAAGGWAADQVVGKHFSCFFRPEDVAAGLPERALRMLRAEGRFEEEGWRLRQTGAQFWAHVALSTLYDKRGGIRGFVRISRNMSAAKAASDARHRAVADAEAARREAERANLSKSRFLAAASHDLRQPVQALLFFTSVLALKVPDAQSREVVRDMTKTLGSLNLLLDSLLDISKLEAGAVTPQFTTFSVNSLLERMEADFSALAGQKGVRLRVVPSCHIVRSDPALLSRAVQNLVANAVRYTERGGIVVGCRRRGAQVAIEVWDSGIGIPEGSLQDIFQEFRQLGSDHAQGLGLGLAIVDRLARLMHHDIEVRSVHGRGSMFAVVVPLAEPAPARLPRAASLAAAHAARRVLVIDDEAIVLKGLSMVLEEWGYEVVVAGSEDEALEVLRDTEAPDAIVADYRLREGRTGTQAVRRIRDHFHSTIPSILITGDTAPERLREARASGLTLLHKPIHAAQLHAVLDSTMNQVRSVIASAPVSICR